MTNRIKRSDRVTRLTYPAISPRARSRDMDGSVTTPIGMPMIPSGIRKAVKAKVNALTDPVARPEASDVATTNVSWLAPSPIARGPMSTSAWRASGSERSTSGR